MAHDHVKDMLDESTGKANAQIVAVLVGGTLLLAAVVARFIFQQETYSHLIAILAALLLGIPLIWQALRDLYTGHMHMNELAALAVLAAFASGEYLESGAIAFFMFIAVLIEHRTALGARKHIEALMRITPTRARKLTDEGEVEVDAAELRPGDRVRVRPGDNIPGDGQVVSGTSTVNQANITGESLPVDKMAGDEVYSGTINVTGAMDVEITKAGQDTTLGRVKDLILQAEMTRSPISRMIDRYAHWYTPVIVMFATIVFFFTQEMDRSIAILIIACPCAIILATPTALVAALSAAARLGVHVKNVGLMETARDLSAVVFDKTGTLTTGELSVTRLTPAAEVEGAELLRAAAAVDQHSRHPVARAILAVAERARLQLPEVEQFEEVSGRGVLGTINGQQTLIGRASWIEEQGIDLTGLDQTGSEGLSLLYVVQGGRPLGWIGLEDKTRPTAAAALDDLRQLGVNKLVMVTGDRWSVAQRVAREMHCSDVQAEVLPAQKLELVDELKKQGHIVAVVGDGVNDAPALAAGDVGIAMGAAGSDVAINSAQIALMNNNLNRIPFLIRLSRKTVNVVRQNLAGSMVYIVGFLALAAFGAIPAVVAVLLHLVSSLVVVFNSARLVREGEDIEHAEASAQAGQTAPRRTEPTPPALPSGQPALG